MISDLLAENGLSFERLQSFCRVAEVGGVTRAAQGDAVKQSLYSRQIKELETFFGAELMRRQGRGVTLTSAGERLYRIAREHFVSLKDFKTECRNQPLEVNIGAGESLIQWLLLPLVGDLQRKIPTANFRFLNLTNTEIVQRLQTGRIDFGLVRSGTVSKPLLAVPIGQVEFSLFVPDEIYGLAEGKSLKTMLSELPLALMEGDGSFRQELKALTTKIWLRG